jgi:hypothetical protein
MGVVDAVLVGQQGEEGAQLDEVVPVRVGPRQAAHLQPQDQADVVHGNLGQQVLEAVAIGDRLAAVPLVVVDEEDPRLVPAQGGGMVGEGVLAVA